MEMSQACAVRTGPSTVVNQPQRRAAGWRRNSWSWPHPPDARCRWTRTDLGTSMVIPAVGAGVQAGCGPGPHQEVPVPSARPRRADRGAPSGARRFRVIGENEREFAFRMGLPGRSSEKPRQDGTTPILTGVLLVQSGGVGGAGGRQYVAAVSAGELRGRPRRPRPSRRFRRSRGRGGVDGVGAGLTSGVGATRRSVKPWAEATMPIKTGARPRG